MMMEALSEDLPMSLKGKVLLAPLWFAGELETLDSKLRLPITKRQKTLICRYESYAKEHGLQKLYFLINLAN